MEAKPHACLWMTNRSPKKSKKIKICIEMNDNENMTIQDLWDWVKVVLSAKREVHSNISLPQETRKTSKPNLTPKANRKTRTKKKTKI